MMRDDTPIGLRNDGSICVMTMEEWLIKKAKLAAFEAELDALIAGKSETTLDLDSMSLEELDEIIDGLSDLDELRGRRC